MPTKFKRYRCSLCNRLKVQWKLISLPSYSGLKLSLCCWQCAKLVRDKLQTIPLDSKPTLKWFIERKGAVIKSVEVERKNPYQILR